jgi:hypothetical protein
MQPRKLRVNVLCLIGAILAAVSLFLPWATVQDQASGAKRDLGAFDFEETFLGFHLFSANFRYSVILFVIGTAVAFLSPLGGIMQLIGCVGFILTTLTTRFEGVEMVFWIGAAVALISTAMVLLSLVSPTGVGYEAGKRLGITRLLTFSAFS